MSEGIIERGDAPVARATNPLWKWAFIATLVVLGAGTLAAVLISELREPEAPPAEANAKPRLKFDVGAYEVPAFPHPVPAVPEPPPAPKPAPMELPAMPGVPELPPPEPRHGPSPTVLPPAPMGPGTPAKHVETPEELAAKRRLAAPLSGSGSTSASTSRGETEAEAALCSNRTYLSDQWVTQILRQFSALRAGWPPGSARYRGETRLPGPSLT